MKAIFIIAVFLFSHVIAKEINTKTEVISSIEMDGKKSYKELMILKTKQEFMTRGLSYPKAMNWYERNKKLEKECGVELRKLPMELRFSGKLSDMCTAFNYLGQVGMHYSKHKNSDDKFTIEYLLKIKEAFDIKK